MPASHPPTATAIPTEVLQQAADWFALLGSPAATAQDRQRWQNWMQAGAHHQAAWARVETINSHFHPLSGSTASQHASSQALQGRVKRQQQRRTVLRSLFALGSVGLMGAAVSRTAPGQRFWAGLGSDHQTAVGEIRHFTLSDASQAWLNTASAIRLEYDAHVRRIVLLYGQIEIETAADPARPLIVQTRYASLRALGTRFDVRQTSQGAHLNVYEGAVEVTLGEHSDTPGRSLVVPAGHQLGFAQGMGQPGILLTPDSDGWTQQLLKADDMPLDTLLQALSPYRRGRLACDPAVAHLRVTGSFPLDDTDRALRMLADALPVQIDAPFSWWVTIRPRPS